MVPKASAPKSPVPEAPAERWNSGLGGFPVQEWNSGLGGFNIAGPLLEFDQVLERIASFTRSVAGGERARSLAPTRDLLEIATRLQETTEARQYLEQGGALEFGPDQDFRGLVQHALLGGVLRGEELFAIRGLLPGGPLRPHGTGPPRRDTAHHQHFGRHPRVGRPGEDHLRRHQSGWGGIGQRQPGVA